MDQNVAPWAYALSAGLALQTAVMSTAAQDDKPPAESAVALPSGGSHVGELLDPAGSGVNWSDGSPSALSGLVRSAGQLPPGTLGLPVVWVLPDMGQ